jgi:predicted outer membrane protein
MACFRLRIAAALFALALAAAVHAQGEAEYSGPMPVPSVLPQQQRLEQPDPPRRVAPRPPAFAPAAAASARRMSPEQRQERHFLKEAAANSRFGAEAARMAIARSRDPGVRSIATTLINHHASVGNELLHMLQMRGMAAPMLSDDHRRVLNRLAKLQGARFDREFVDEVALRYQQEDVNHFERASLAAGDAPLGEWIERTLPALRYNLATAQQLAPGGPRLARAAPQPPPVAGSRATAAAEGATYPPGTGQRSDRGKRSGVAQVTPVPEGGMQFGGIHFAGEAQPRAQRPAPVRPIGSDSR